MIRIFTQLIAVALLTIIACTDQEMNEQQNEVNSASPNSGEKKNINPDVNPFNRATGAPIDGERAQQWISNYETANQGCDKNYLIKSNTLKSILGDTKCVGICFMYAVDPYKMTHILPIGIDEKRKYIPAKYINTQRGNISWKIAQQWISNYTGSTKSHFFGQNTFSRLWENGTADILITFAKDNNNSPQLLLSPHTAAKTNGKTAAKPNFEDASAACPPACPK